MPHPMFVAHARRLEPLRAEQLLDAAQAAIAVHAPKEWWDSLATTARGEDRPSAEAATADSESMFIFNGMPVSIDELKGTLAEALGAGLTIERTAA